MDKPLEIMDIYSPEGTKVVFIGQGGMEQELAQALEVLQVGREYTVVSTEVSSWRTEVFLEEASGSFNSVMFVTAESWRNQKS